jgi:hypothetical protein
VKYYYGGRKQAKKILVAVWWRKLSKTTKKYSSGFTTRLAESPVKAEKQKTQQK